MKKRLTLILFIIVFAIITSPGMFQQPKAHAAIASVPSSMLVIGTETYAFRHILETDDALFMAPYYINSDDWVGYDGIDIIAQLENHSGTIIKQKTLEHLDGGIIGFYINNSEFAANFTWPGSENARIILRANPAVFLADPSIDNTGDQGLVDATKEGTGSNDEWIGTDNHSDTVDDMRSRLPGMLNALGNEDSIDYLEGDKINLAGGGLIVEAFTWIVTIAPEAFILGSLTLNPDFSATGTIALQLELDSLDNTAIDSVTGLATGLGFNPSIFGLIVIILISAPVILMLRNITEDNAFAFASISGLLVWWTSLGLLSVALIMTISLILFAILGIWLWNRIPTG